MLLLRFFEQRLNVLFSSSKSIKFLFNEVLVLDLIDRFFNFKYLTFLTNQKLKVQFLVLLPYSNSLIKFKNKIYIILYLLIFKLLVFYVPDFVPVYKKKVVVQSKKDFFAVDTEIESFVISAEITKENFFNFFFFLRVFASKNTYQQLVAPSRQITIKVSDIVRNNYLRVFLLLNAGVNVFDFFENFDEIVLAKIKTIISFKLKNIKHETKILLYVLQSLNFNVLNSSDKKKKLKYVTVKRLLN